jgi:protein translocase SecG subunit
MGIIQNLLPWIQITLSVILILTILLQQNSSSAGAAFGGGESGTLHTTRRGFEKVLFITTIVVAVLFAVSAVFAVIL